MTEILRTGVLILGIGVCLWLTAKALEPDQPQAWGEYSNGKLIDTHDSYEKCKHISDDHGACQPIAKLKRT